MTDLDFGSRHIVFVSGTRADFGKLKPLIAAADSLPFIEISIFVTGMHMFEIYGSTWIEVEKFGIGQIHKFVNHDVGDPMDMVLGKTILGFSDFVAQQHPDLIVVHGDRLEALACASVGTLSNTPVAHIEGGEISGTVDESMRHAITKLSHLHLVSNNEARATIEQLGEVPKSIHVIGSPDIDVMNSSNLPSNADVKKRYEIPFDEFGIALLHPVTTDAEETRANAISVTTAILSADVPFIVILPNNDSGFRDILSAYRQLESASHVRVFPSLRFEYFLSALRSSRVLLGNSSAGIREAPHYGVPTVNVGSRQSGRGSAPSIINVSGTVTEVNKGLAVALSGHWSPTRKFGDGNSGRRFHGLLQDRDFWSVSVQKRLRRLPSVNS